MFPLGAGLGGSIGGWGVGIGASNAVVGHALSLAHNPAFWKGLVKPFFAAPPNAANQRSAKVPRVAILLFSPPCDYDTEPLATK
jgi:hypothetical protein